MDITRDKQSNKAYFLRLLTNLLKIVLFLCQLGGECLQKQIFNILKSGADKIVINSKAIEKPLLIRESAKKKYGTQCVVVSMDVYKSKNNSYEVFSNCGTILEQCRLDPENGQNVRKIFGAGEIMLNSINNDGTLEGYDNNLNRMV